MSRSLIVALVAVLAIVVTGFVILSDRGRDIASYATFLGGPLVTGIVGLLLAERQSRIKAVVDKVKVQTDGLLSARLDSVDRQLDSAAVDRAENAAARPEPQAS